jgi:N-formylmaleamate deformylase
MTNWQTIDVTVNGIKLHVTRTGGEKPALVLVHGVTDNGLCWSPVARALCADYDVIMVDARGHGRSDAPTGGYDLTTLAEDLHGVIQALGLNKPRVLGHSLGAGTTLLMAALYPDTPGAIVLEDPPQWWLKAPTTERSQWLEEFIANATQQKSQTFQEILDDGRALHPQWSAAELEPWAQSKLEFNLDAIVAIFASDHSAAVDWEGLLPHVTCPVLALPADPALGAALTPAGVEALQALVPQTLVETIAGAGHNIRREQFEVYLHVLRAFLIKH